MISIASQSTDSCWAYKLTLAAPMDHLIPKVMYMHTQWSLAWEWQVSLQAVCIFENIDDISASLIQEEIKTSLENYEPRVELVSVKAYPDVDNNSFDVTIVYRVIGADILPQQLEFVLQPTR